MAQGVPPLTGGPATPSQASVASSTWSADSPHASSCQLGHPVATSSPPPVERGTRTPGLQSSAAPPSGAECAMHVPFGCTEWHAISRQLRICQSLRHPAPPSTPPPHRRMARAYLCSALRGIPQVKAACRRDGVSARRTPGSIPMRRKHEATPPSSSRCSSSRHRDARRCPTSRTSGTRR